MTLSHLKNKEIFQIKEKIKHEKSAAHEELTRRKKDKEEHEKKIYYTVLLKITVK